MAPSDLNVESAGVCLRWPFLRKKSTYDIFPYISHIFPIYFLYVSYMFPIYFPYISYMFPIYFLYASYMFPIYFPYISYMFPLDSPSGEVIHLPMGSQVIQVSHPAATSAAQSPFLGAFVQILQ